MADDITVTPRDDGSFDVEVRRGATTTRHVVTVPAALAARADRPDADPVRMVEISFEFLLEREPPSSILRTFDLDVIGRYFPEYPHELTRRLA